jgi:C1A family cysteine protease
MNKGIIAALLGSAAASQIVSPQEYQFFNYMATYGKTYGTKAEYEFRFKVFADRLAQIEAHNSKEGVTSTMGINKFSDWTQEEIKKMNGLLQADPADDNVVIFPTEGLADSIDWREKGAVTPVKNQGQCGSCWAFSTTGSLEGAHFMATGNLVSLSESNLVDCSYLYLNLGCNGGLMDRAFRYAKKHPIETEADYPYVPKSSPFDCKYKKEKGLVKVSSFADVKANSPEQLKAALNKGPVSVGIEADQPVFHAYTGGIINDSSCGTMMDHGVLAVGYGSDAATGLDFYIVKNSWGADWGENGYVRIAIQDGEGICGIQAHASQPTTD